MVIKGVPQIINELKEFYKDQEKIQAIEEILTSFKQNMDKNMKLQESDADEQDPTVYLWILYYLALHFYHKRDIEQALTHIDEAIEHTPTVIELYIVKAKILQRGGNRTHANYLHNEARKLDYADRYLNAESARY
jgi:peptide alpha-N-acetyltransferase